MGTAPPSAIDLPSSATNLDNNSSLTKRRASSRYPVQPAARAPADEAIQARPTEARITNEDLTDQIQAGSPAPSSSRHDLRSSVASPANKRKHKEVDHSKSDREEENSLKRAKIERVVFVPTEVYGHIKKPVLLVLKVSWQDLQWAEEPQEVMDKLTSRSSREDCHNVVVPIRVIKEPLKGKPCTTLETIRGFFGDDLCGFPVENHTLTITTSELKRPVEYFWGVHDFVRGLHGALLGHEYLISLGILHRDISENNIVLALRPGSVRGYLIDFDMATLRQQEKPVKKTRDRHDIKQFLKPPSPIPADGSLPQKALRTGTTPYMSFNVLEGRTHTYYDDIESFLYVLTLFFFSYAGPLPEAELKEADRQGFVQSRGSGRLPHMKHWPSTFVFWAEDDTKHAAALKHRWLSLETGSDWFDDCPSSKECLVKNWKELDLLQAIVDLLEESWQLFIDSRRSGAGELSLEHTKVTHKQFTKKLQWWLDEYAGIEDKYSPCPFS